MSELALHPTVRDEDWRYADADYLATSDTESLTQWANLQVAPGTVQREYREFLSDDSVVERLRVHVGAGGRFECFAVTRSGPYCRLELEVTLEDGAHFEFGGVTIGGGDKVQEYVTRIIHAQPNATSNQLVRAVQWGRAKGNFLGRVEVVRDAQKTNAGQNFRAILLERGASANAKPELEIFADDVKCAHGAAIGELDPNIAFYMASRGLPPAAARILQVHAFIADAFEAVEDDAMRERLMGSALAALEDSAL